MKTTLLLIATVLLIGRAVPAQDLQYRMVMSTLVPQMPDMPAPSMMVYQKGTKIRVEAQIPLGKADPPSLPDYMQTSTIVDQQAGKIFLLDAETKEFDERPFTMPEFDTAQARQLAELPGKFRETGDTLTIQGYRAKRFVLSMEMPFNPVPSGKKDGRFVMIMETWGTSDTTLTEAYRIFQALQELQSPGSSSRLSDLQRVGFPVRNTVLMVNVPATGSYDVESLLKAGANAPGLQMRMSTEIRDIKTVRLDPALFEVPKDYRRR